MKKKLWLTLGGLAAFLLIGIITAGNYFYSEGIKRGTDIELHSGSEAVSTAATEHDQTLLAKAEGWYDNQETDRINLTAFDGLTLSAQIIEQEETNHKAVILAHGFRHTGDDMGKLAKYYYDQGFDILLPDARGHGKSEGDYIGYGWHDRLDYLDWIRRLIHDYDADQIILHGNSMGAATVLMTSGEDLPKEVKGIIADSGYSTIKAELAHQLDHLYGLPSFPLLDITSAITRMRAGYFLGEGSVVKQVKQNTKPLLLIHGKSDELVPTDMARDIYDAAGGEKNLWLVPGTGHTKAYDNHTAEFQNRVQAFLDKALTD